LNVPPRDLDREGQVVGRGSEAATELLELTCARIAAAAREMLEDSLLRGGEVRFRLRVVAKAEGVDDRGEGAEAEGEEKAAPAP